MAKVLDGIDRGHESADVILSPRVRPCPLALADRDRRAKLGTWLLGSSATRCLVCRRPIA